MRTDVKAPLALRRQIGKRFDSCVDLKGALLFGISEA